MNGNIGGLKTFLLDVVRGCAIGVAFIIPGFSGGSVAAILGIYEKLVGAIADIFKDFTRAVLKGTPLLAPGEEGVKGLTISNAIHYSAWTGKWADTKNFPHEEFYELLQDKIAKSTVVKAEVQRTTATEGTY